MRKIITRFGSQLHELPLRKLASSFATLPRESKSCVDTNAFWESPTLPLRERVNNLTAGRTEIDVRRSP